MGGTPPPFTDIFLLKNAYKVCFLPKKDLFFSPKKDRFGGYPTLRTRRSSYGFGGYPLPPFTDKICKVVFEEEKWENAVRLTALVDPPRSGQVNVNISQQVAIFGVIFPFYIGQKWVKIFTKSFSQAVSLTAFCKFSFDDFPLAKAQITGI